MISIAIGAALGFFAGIVPGPFLALVATTAVQKGKRAGRRVALVPLGTEIPPMLAAVLVLTRLPDAGLRWMGVVGGAFLLYLAWRVARQAREAGGDPEPDEQAGARLSHIIALGLVSPTPWAFWFLVGGPITVNRWHEGPVHAALFVGTFLAFFVGTLVAAAWAAGSTGGRLGSTGSRRVGYVGAGFLAIAGGVIGWQSWLGNFAEMVRAPERIEQEIGLRSDAPSPGTAPFLPGTDARPRPLDPASNR